MNRYLKFFLGCFLILVVGIGIIFKEELKLRLYISYAKVLNKQYEKIKADALRVDEKNIIQTVQSGLAVKNQLLYDYYALKNFSQSCGYESSFGIIKGYDKKIELYGYNAKAKSYISLLPKKMQKVALLNLIEIMAKMQDNEKMIGKLYSDLNLKLTEKENNSLCLESVPEVSYKKRVNVLKENIDLIPYNLEKLDNLNKL